MQGSKYIQEQGGTLQRRLHALRLSNPSLRRLESLDTPGHTAELGQGHGKLVREDEDRADL